MYYSQSSPEKLKSRPTPGQVFTLAAGAMCLAKDQGRLRQSRKPANRANLFVSESLEDVMDTEDFGYTTQTFTGRVERHDHGLRRRWSMILVERFWAVEYDAGEDADSRFKFKQGDASRTTYKFEWTPISVDAASRQVRMSSEDSDDTELSMDDGLLLPDIMHAANQMEAVSQADCLRLLKDVRSFADTLRQQQVA